MKTIHKTRIIILLALLCPFISTAQAGRPDYAALDREIQKVIFIIKILYCLFPCFLNRRRSYNQNFPGATKGFGIFKKMTYQ